MADRIGQQLGNYRLLRLLGQGGQASVYLGEHIYLKSQAAIKVRHAALTDEEQTVFLQEAQTLVRLTHPHIVRVLDFALQDGMPFLVMEYAPHGTLRRLHPKGKRLPLDVILPYVQQVASALQYTHDQRLIHRDVKPENLLLNSQNQVLLSDFGLVMHAPQSLSPDATEPMEQSLAGTTPYLAPEQLRGKTRPASDQYALGVVVYEWLCGKPPFQGPFLEVAVQHVSVPPPSLREQVPDLTPAIEEVVLRALAKEPEARFASVQEFALALEEACRPELASGQTQCDLSSQRSSEAQQAPKHNLPVQPTPFIGREQEVARTCELLSRSEVRLLTLTGPGGTGKTRLGLQVAAELSDRFTDGVFFIALAPINDPALVMPTIAETLDIREVAGHPPIERLKEALHKKQILLLLDNFEQVVSAASQVADLLVACPKLKVLVTSREVLHVRAEHEFAVPPLELPDPTHLPDLTTLSHYAAVALFLRRAQAVKPDFQITNANARAIAEICARLDGLPLAIELAAARMKLLSPQALLTRLGQRLQVLTSATRDVPARQQTLRNTIAWSYDLLNTDEQRLFRRLSVFVGGCTLEALEAVCAALDGADGGGSILDGVGSLNDKSLLRQQEQKDGEPWFMMLETIRDFGLEALVASEELEVVQEAHALYYLALAEQAEPHLKGAEQSRWYARLEQEQDNLRAALAWLLEAARKGLSNEEERQQAERALRLCAALCWFWSTRGRLREGWTALSQGLAVGAGVAASVRARALCAAADLWLTREDMDRAQARAEEGLALFRELGDTAGIAHALDSLALFSWMKSQYAVARSQLEEANVLFQEVSDTWSSGLCLTQLARIATAQGEYDRAHTLLEESRGLYSALGDQYRVGFVLYLQARVLFLSGSNLAGAQVLAEQSLALLRTMGDELFYSHTSAVLILLGQLRLQQGEQARARELFEASLATVKKTLGNLYPTAEALIGLARVAALQDEVEEAYARYQESLVHLHELDHKELIPVCLEGLADMVAAQGELAWAVRLWGAAEALREAIGTPLPPIERADYERAITAVRTRLDEKVFTTAWAEGRTMTLEQVLTAKGPVTVPTPGPIESPSIPASKPVVIYPDGLTAREVEVLGFVAKGLTDAQIAEQLVISPRTVNTHLTSIYGKIQVSSRSGATRYAIEHQLV